MLFIILDVSETETNFAETNFAETNVMPKQEVEIFRDLFIN